MRENPNLIEQRAYTVEAFCAAYGVGKTTTFAAMKEGKLQAVKAGRRLLIPRDSAEAWFASLPSARGNVAA
ncbi:helix-turn-helix domain-containing protein [Acetobacteraceae bacterium H6797]|nr:helix-turn-helix domain-containing protein [Acetobacteraceae bacterium H6797]